MNNLSEPQSWHVPASMNESSAQILIENSKAKTRRIQRLLARVEDLEEALSAVCTLFPPDMSEDGTGRTGWEESTRQIVLHARQTLEEDCE